MKINNEINNNSNFFELKIKDNSYVRELKQLIGDKITCFWTQIELEINDEKISQECNGMFIKELGLKNGNTLTVKRR